MRIRVRLAWPEVALHPEGQQVQVAGNVKLLYEPPCELLLYCRCPAHLLHQLKAAHTADRSTAAGLPLNAVDCPQDLDVVPPEGHPHLPQYHQPPLKQSVRVTRGPLVLQDSVDKSPNGAAAAAERAT
jgi:hypothetical protein